MSKKYLRLDKRPKGLTMGEFVIGLGIIAVLALILIPIYRTVQPNKNEALGKKANYIVNRIINELITDEYLYPDNMNIKGFGNLSTVTYNGSTHEGFTKFCTLFAARLNKLPGSEVNCEEGQKSVTSIEGMDWYLPISSFRDNDYEIIKVDVNGEEEPNCKEGPDCKFPDQFEFKVPKAIEREETTVTENFTPTAAPPAKIPQAAAPDSADKDSRTAQNVYEISCGGSGATIYGEGGNKVNGTYTLVAVPKKGYKCNWFIHQVTVKDADVTDCNLSCEPDNNIPVSDGETIPPTPTPGDDDDDDTEQEEEKTFCITKVVSGDSDGCTISGKSSKDCGLSPGTYKYTSDAKTGYTASWAVADVEITDKDETLTLECIKDEEEKCYNITVNVTGQCAVDGAGCKTPGTYALTITPSDNYTYNNSTGSSNYSVVVTDSDVNVSITCEPPAPNEEDSDPCCEKNFGAGAKYIAKSNACIKDLGIQSSEAVDCGKDKTYCTGNWAYWNYPAVYPTSWKACLDLKMDIPSKSKFLELYNNRQSVFPESHWYTNPRQSGYYTNESTRYLPESQSASQYNGKYVWQYTVHVPYDNQVHSIAPRNSGARAMCWATAPAECKSSSNSDSGTDVGSINVVITSATSSDHKSSLNYTVTWSINNPPLAQGKKYKVNATDWVSGKPFYTYYGVTSTTSGSHSGTVTGIPSHTPSNQVKLTVSFY